jgi:hypothetical protein
MMTEKGCVKQVTGGSAIVKVTVRRRDVNNSYTNNGRDAGAETLATSGTPGKLKAGRITAIEGSTAA